ncbi:MAG TPA: transglutaminase-like domain-containing protein [Smithella sp.]|nr:transglutaminase-like domain-containing protein [Smithella sp.]
MQKIKWNMVWGILITFAFFLLLLIRLEFFQKKTEPAVTIQMSKSRQPEDTWMNIYQNNNKIGLIHRTFTDAHEKFHFVENVFMQINVMGVTQDLNLLTDGDLNPDMTLSSFNFNLNSGIFHFNAHGHIIKNRLILFTGSPPAQEKSEIPLKDIPHISGNIYETAFHNDLEKGSTRNINIFDPSTLSIRAIKVTRDSDEIITIMGKRILTKKYCADFMGSKNCAWLNKEGDVVKETGMLGITMEKVNRQKAMEGIASGQSVDFTQIASVPSNVEIADPEGLREIKIRLSGISDTLSLNNDRQSYRHNILTITRESMPLSSTLNHHLPANIAGFLKPAALIQSDNPQIKRQVNNIIKPTDSDEQKARKIVDWVYRNIEKKPVLSVPNALEVLKNRAGACKEHSVLTVSLLRAAGIPAQIEAGLVYLRGRFYYHEWCVLYLNKWITADAVFNQFPADVTHIMLVRGNGEEQLNLIGIIGKIKLEVLEQIK